MVKVKVGSMEKEYTSKTTLYEIAKDFKNQYSNDIVLAECDEFCVNYQRKLMKTVKLSLLQRILRLVMTVTDVL